MSVSINYREDVSDQRGAERALAGHPPRAFITWRVGDSDAEFMLSYNSQGYKSTAHIPLRRGTDGSFRAIESRDEGAFRTLADFIVTRRYIDSEAAVRVLDSATSSGDGVRRRTAANIGGRAELPPDLPLPAPRTPVARGGDTSTDDADAAAVPPSCRPEVQNVVFGVAVCCALVIGGWAFSEYREHEARVVAQAATLTAAITEVVADANLRLHAALESAGQAGAQDPVLCGSAATDWRATLAAAVPRVQAEFAAGDAPVFIRHALNLCLVALAGAWALLLITTGKRAAPTVDAPTEEELAADPTAAAAVLNGPRDPPCTAMQARWAFAFSSLVGVAALSSFLCFNVLWEFGGPSKVIEYAAKPMCSAHNWADSINATTGEVVWRHILPRPRRRSPESIGDAGNDGSVALASAPWPAGDYAAALHVMRASPRCAAAMQKSVGPLALMPPLLRVPLRAACPAPLFATLRFAAATWHRILRARGVHSHAAHASVGAFAGGSGDAFTIADPLAGTALHGWMDGDLLLGGGEGAHLVLPSHAGISFAVVNLTFYILVTFMGTLMAADAARSSFPRWKAWVRVRELRGRRAAAITARSAATISTSTTSHVHRE